MPFDSTTAASAACGNRAVPKRRCGKRPPRSGRMVGRSESVPGHQGTNNGSLGGRYSLLSVAPRQSDQIGGLGVLRRVTGVAEQSAIPKGMATAAPLEGRSEPLWRVRLRDY